MNIILISELGNGKEKIGDGFIAMEDSDNYLEETITG